MIYSGEGATFNQNDINMAKRIVGLIKRAKFDLNASEMVAGTEALTWFEQELMPGMEQCVFEIIKVSKPSPDSIQEN